VQPEGSEGAAAAVAAAAEATGAGGAAVAAVEGAELRAVAQPVAAAVSDSLSVSIFLNGVGKFSRIFLNGGRWSRRWQRRQARGAYS
jgi:hypothetical protein